MTDTNNLQPRSTPRPATAAELHALYAFEWDNRYDMDCIGERAELASEIEQRISNAHIAVFDNPGQADAARLMLVMWEPSSRYVLYTLAGETLRIVQQDANWFEDLYATHVGD